MDSYRISVEQGLTIIEHCDLSAPLFRMSVEKDRQLAPGTNTAVLEALLYREEGVFVKNGNYVFEALDSDNKPLSTDVDIDQFKLAVDFFFTSILNTDLYLKRIPKESSLCEGEMKTFKFD